MCSVLGAGAECGAPRALGDGGDGLLRPAALEDEIYSTLGLLVIPPEIRTGDDEIDAAWRGTLPTLVSRNDILGDLHMHTVWSDGRDSVEAMVDI